MGRAKGTGVSRAAAALVALMGLLAVLGVGASGAGAAEPLGALWQRCDGGAEDLACKLPRGIGVSPLSGHLYAVDNGEYRMVELTAWGEFVRAWGWGVADGSEELQVCTSPASCQAGIRGAGSGQFEGPQGVAVDSEGNVYVSEFAARRVQKFDSEGNFILMFGGEVNKTRSEEGGSTEAQRNLCTAASGDVCQKGVQGTGDGQFGQQVVASFIAIGSADKVYVGDKGRIQIFNPDGTYLEDLPDPDAVIGAQKVQALATGPGNALWVALNGSSGVWKLNATSGARVCEAAGVEEPSALAADPAGNVYAVDEAAPARVRQLSSSCVDREAPFGEGALSQSTGIAAGAACLSGGKADVYVSNRGPDFVRAYGPAPTNEGLCLKPIFPPQILSQFTVSVNSEAAVVRASVNPRFYADTTSYVQYGTAACLAGGWPAAEAAECLKEQPAPPGPPLGAGAIDLPSLTGPVALRDLAPGTEYRYRFVADSKGGGPVHGRGGTPAEEGADAHFKTYPEPASIGDCPNEVYRTGLGAQLPDCRAYEMVSPVDKEGADVLVGETVPHRAASLNQSSASGGRFTYSAYRAFADPESSPFASQYLARREPGSGWETQAISPPRGKISGPPLVAHDTEFKVFSSDLCTGWLVRDNTTAPPLAAGAAEDSANLYKRSNCGGSEWETVGKEALEVQGISRDGSQSIFRVQSGLERLVYESDLSRPSVPVCILPSGLESSGCSAGTAAPNGFNVDSRSSSVTHALSMDGGTVFWSDASNSPAKIYARVNSLETQSSLDGGGNCVDAAKACTYGVSTGTAQFWLAAADGSEALFTTDAPGAGALLSTDLYLFDTEAAVDGAGDPTELIASGVAGVVGGGEDLGTIYLVSSDVLSEGVDTANSEGAVAVDGEPNLYLYEGGKFVFVATLARADAIARTGGSTTPTPVNTEPFKHSARVSPDGQTVTFMSTAPLTGSDNTDINSGEADSEVFRYDARSNQLSCVSCNPSGARPAGREISYSGGFWAAAQLPSPESQLYASHVLSDDGTRVFFESFEPLVNADTNGKQDVYEWEAPGAGTCTKTSPAYTPSDEGCLSLISGGESPQDSDLLDATPTGSDVFFRTGASLLPRDPGLFDVYDARVDGGFPEPHPDPPCEGEACQSPPAAPQLQTPASAAFHGPGDKPGPRKRCRKGRRRVVRHGRARCVKRHRHRRRHAHHHRRHHPRHARAQRRSR